MITFNCLIIIFFLCSSFNFFYQTKNNNIKTSSLPYLLSNHFSFFNFNILNTLYIFYIFYLKKKSRYHLIYIFFEN